MVLQMTNDCKKLLDVLFPALIQKYHEIIKEPQALKEIKTNSKGQKSLYIDIMLENFLFEQLERMGIHGVFLAEEYGSPRYFGKTTADEKYIIVLDPIDGSTNLKRNIPFSTIALAIGKAAEDEKIPTFRHLQCGAIYDIGTGDQYIAIKGEKAEKNGKTIKTQTLTQKKPLTVLYTDQRGLRLMPKIAATHQLRNFGSASLELAYVAEGRIDMYIDIRGRLSIYDIAPSILLIKEAGGSVFLTDKSIMNILDHIKENNTAYDPNAFLSIPVSLSTRYSVIAAANNRLIEDFLHIVA